MGSSVPADFVALYARNLIPLYVVLCSLVWVLHDYCTSFRLDLQKQRPNFGRIMFFWIRYYTIVLLIFDVLQIHSFTLPWVRTPALCLAADPTTRIVGAISLWSVEIVMQLRIYALYNRSKKVALFNGVLFIISIGLFLWVMVVNAKHRNTMIAELVELPLIGCPVVNGGSQWALWVPATVYEFILFGFAVYKNIVSSSARIKLNNRKSLTAVLLQENIIYFFVIGCLLVVNNLMVVRSTGVPWFGFGPFHAAMGIATSRMFIHLRKFASNLDGMPDSIYESNSAPPAAFAERHDLRDSFDSDDSSIGGFHDLESMAGSSRHSDSLSVSPSVYTTHLSSV
ncbi:hypothetical protein M413DRAFT_74975 [Hebeloma cylindrosporum]|uniref:G-protein coupled receptors family 1 profile domain-containing protein n=1 Tax=Hebeloma cylindrosporum TaxID=76867 RepID=A0A0C2YEC0_HEBCY|nr:hypothetical protein M413DRAFT_74975 [Hebeloma cylindrosporum h7]